MRAICAMTIVTLSFPIAVAICIYKTAEELSNRIMLWLLEK